MNPDKRFAAYFTMEIALENAMPSYSGGLGVLAGDTIRAAADLRFPLVAVSLLYRSGYFTQRLTSDGVQVADPVEWRPEDFLKEEQARVSVPMERRDVQLRCWRYDVPGVSGGDVPVYFLDADLPANEESDRALTGNLYGGDPLYRLRQEVLLGIGGARMLQALGHTALGRYHMNEGHAALLTLELLAEEALKLGRSSIRAEDIEKVRAKCVFTTHTPVAAGHDRFPLEYLIRLFPDHLNFLDLQDPAAAALLKRVLQTDRSYGDLGEAARDGAYLNMSYLALSLSHFVNAVARQHGETSRKMFPDVRVESITNGVHAASWMSPPFQRLLDRYISYWREDSLALRLALRIPAEAVWAAHQAAKRELLQEVHRKTGLSFDPEAFTIGFARRVTGYKRADLILNNLDRLRQIVRNAGKLQIIYAGKAHPNDTPGQEIIGRIFKAQKALRKSVKTVFLENYNLELARKLTSGVDLWLNTPQFPLEASGTSGMKAALNGVPSLSILDGWWVEGHIEGLTGWSIGESRSGPAYEGVADNRKEADSLYSKLEHVILPLFYRDRGAYLNVMRHTMAINGAFFNTRRMVQEYITQAYLR